MSRESHLWNYDRLVVSLITESWASRQWGLVLRVESPACTVDLGPADQYPVLEDVDGMPQPTGAQIVLGFHGVKPLTGEALDAAKLFLRQWPEHHKSRAGWVGSFDSARNACWSNQVLTLPAVDVASEDRQGYRHS